MTSHKLDAARNFRLRNQLLGILVPLLDWMSPFEHHFCPPFTHTMSRIPSQETRPGFENAKVLFIFINLAEVCIVI